MRLPVFKIKGLRVVGFRGSKMRKNQKDIDLEYILFSDGKTYIELEHQDYYDNHDCDGSARLIRVKQDKMFYNILLNCHRTYGVPNICSFDW